MAKLILPEVPPSWNQFYSGVHWATRNEIVKYWHDLVYYHCKSQSVPPFRVPVLIHYHIYKEKHLIDTDNWNIKLITDGLKLAGIIKDDSPKYVPEIRITTYKAKKTETVVIIDEWSYYTLKE